MAGDWARVNNAARRLKERGAFYPVYIGVSSSFAGRGEKGTGRGGTSKELVDPICRVTLGSCSGEEWCFPFTVSWVDVIRIGGLYKHLYGDTY